MAYFEKINIKELFEEDDHYTFPPFTEEILEKPKKRSAGSFRNPMLRF